MKIKCFVGGRFQPPHPGHKAMYDYCSNKFDYVRLTSSNKVEDKSPFSFDDKELIWRKMFGIQISYSSNPTFVPREYLNDGDILVVATSEKDSTRYSHTKFFKPFEDNIDYVSWDKGGYYIVIPEMENGISASYIRSNIKYNKSLFEEIYGKFDQEIYDLFNLRIP